MFRMTRRRNILVIPTLSLAKGRNLLSFQFRWWWIAGEFPQSLFVHMIDNRCVDRGFALKRSFIEICIY
jgi:hypothetical protein